MKRAYRVASALPLNNTPLAEILTRLIEDKPATASPNHMVKLLRTTTDDGHRPAVAHGTQVPSVTDMPWLALSLLLYHCATNAELLDTRKKRANPRPAGTVPLAVEKGGGSSRPEGILGVLEDRSRRCERLQARPSKRKSAQDFT